MILTKQIRSRYLSSIPFFSFSKKSRKELLTTIDKANEKIRLKQSVTDIKQLQNYLHQTSTNKNLNININRTTKYDEEFKQFLDQYKSKNRQFANIIDLSHYSKDQNIGNKTTQIREEEIRMLEEFRKRKAQEALELDTVEESKIRKIHPYDTHLDKSVDELYKNESFIICLLEKDATTQITTLNRITHFR